MFIVAVETVEYSSEEEIADLEEVLEVYMTLVHSTIVERKVTSSNFADF